MTKEYPTALLLVLKPSIHLKKMVIFIHALALAASIAVALALTIKLSLLALLGINCWLTVRRLNAKNYTIKYTESLGWELSEGNGFASVNILKSTVITTQVLFFHFKYASQAHSWKSSHKKTLLVVNDALAEEDYRCLIVKLKTTVIK